MAKANERTFQGILLNAINLVCENNKNNGFEKITQEEQVGAKSISRFSDIKLYSSTDLNKIVSFELKNLSWDATDEALAADAQSKANLNGYEYFVTGTPRQLVIFKTFEAGKAISERKLKIFYLPKIQKIDDILRPTYQKEIVTALKSFLK